jgi:hypothetical protein
MIDLVVNHAARDSVVGDASGRFAGEPDGKLVTHVMSRRSAGGRQQGFWPDSRRVRRLRAGQNCWNWMPDAEFAVALGKFESCVALV